MTDLVKNRESIESLLTAEAVLRSICCGAGVSLALRQVIGCILTPRGYPMIRPTVAVFLLLSLPAITYAQPAAPTKPGATVVRYGDNATAGRTFTHDGIKLYYEVYGVGEPLLLVHGNGGSIADLAAQIDHFRKRYKVIAMDSRDHGKSADSPDAITYEKMTDDLAALLDHVKVGPVNVLGWSDGGIEALLLGIRHPAKVKKLASMAANLNPTDQALPAEVISLVKTMLDGMPAEARATPQGQRERKVTGMMLAEPHIEPKALEAIKAPTLVLAGDHDLIRLEHIVEIYNHLPNSQLAILPNATHMVPFDDPATFNAVVDRFFRAPFVKKDRVNDTMKSLERLRAAQRR
jgi:pimeloyl-ACP methyl ester carboxylesterase